MILVVLVLCVATERAFVVEGILTPVPVGASFELGAQDPRLIAEVDVGLFRLEHVACRIADRASALDDPRVVDEPDVAPWREDAL